eukprot:3372961-Prymnesium_polylepis.1
MCVCVCVSLALAFKLFNGVLRALSRAASARMVRAGGRRALRGAQGVRPAEAPLDQQEGPGDGT